MPHPHYPFSRGALALIILAVGAFGTARSQPRGTPVRSTDRRIIDGGNALGFTLIGKLGGGDGARNVIISPFSIAMALGMTLDGARTTTQSAMAGMLGWEGLERDRINAACRGLIDSLLIADPKVTFRIANSIWYRQGLAVHPEFLASNKASFDAEVRPINFGARSASSVINGWVSKKTEGKIKTIVPDPIPNDLVMYLINAIYFNGTWATAFDQKNTQEDRFTAHDGSTVACSMMHMKGSLRYTDNPRFQAVDLPYGAGAYSMTILLPRENISADTLMNDLSTESWQRWTTYFAPADLDLSLPKFKLEYKATLNNVLQETGMAVAFGDGADFSGIAGAPGDLAISEVVHKTFIEVKEEGTEAAAVTSIGIRTTSASANEPRIITMRVDRPFIFAIREARTGAILFLGRIANPAL